VILAIDTSAAISVAVVDGSAVVASRSEFAPRGHAELLADLVRQSLADAGTSRAERVVVGTGPAPFTGLRVGLVTARTLAYAWGVPLDGVCSLDAVGHAHGGTCTVVADARRREVYWATYAEGVRVDGPAVSAPGDVSVQGDVVGRGALLYPDHFPRAVTADPDPAHLIAVADAARAAGAVELSSEPLYLRRPDVHGLAS
jgi:tRNA threonylcarbamoyladenosine biosynthesis protein TsaB